jgi:uncharacterized protein YkwD
VKRVPLAFALLVTVTGALFPEGAPAVDEAGVVSVNRLESRMLTRLNTLRMRRGLTPLRVSAALSSAARQHTKDMARNGFCGHDSADGTNFWERVSRFYARGRGWRAWAAAENVLCYPRRLTAAAALRQWLGSPGHRANLLSSQWREVGVAALYAESPPGDFAGEDTLFVTANFGARS